MIFDMEEETLLPADYSPPTKRASRQYRTMKDQVVFGATSGGQTGQTIHHLAIHRTGLVGTIAHALKVLLLSLVIAALAVVGMAIFQYFLATAHIISWPI